jgi:16S rRNA (guanine527-N7)-methyltransferase
MTDSFPNEKILLRTILGKNSVAITDAQLNSLYNYKLELLSWNKKINLISRRDDDLFRNHFLISLAILFNFKIPAGATVLDLGTGGGLPGIPLAILNPDCQFTLLDSIRKKTIAVSEIVQSLNLTNVNVICDRAESLNKKPEWRNSFIAVIARAVTDLKTLIQWSLPFLKKGAPTPSHGHTKPTDISAPVMLFLKGGEINQEMQNAKLHYQNLSISVIDIKFPGDENLKNHDKKLVIVRQ